VQGAVSPDHYTGRAGRNAGVELESKTRERARFVAPLLAAGARVLEIGCAEGSLGRALKSALPLHYTGLELSADAAAAASVLDEIHSIPIESTPRTQFDAILSFHVLEHVADIAGHARALAARTKPNGVVVVEVPHRSGHPLLEADPNREHLPAFTPASLALLLERARLSVAHLSIGHVESAMYPDSMRVVARLHASSAAALEARFSALPREGVIVVGVGGDFEGYVRPYLGCFRCLGLADGSSAHAGRVVDGFTVEPTAEIIARTVRPHVLIATHRHREEVRAGLLSLGVEPDRIIDLATLLAPTGSIP
jgi:SAM-dependent methyltransferase